MSGKLRLLVMLAAALPSGALGVQGAAAQSDQPGFSLTAVGFDSFFRYRLDAGRAQTGAVRVVNGSGETITVVLRAADVSTAATGGLQYGKSRAVGDGRWLELGRARVRLSPGESLNVPFRLRAPRGAAPGDHFAGIVAVNERDLRAARRRGSRRSVSLRFLPRLAIAVQATIPGGRSRELTAGNAAIEITPSATNATLLVRHTGDRLIRATAGDLTLLEGNRQLVVDDVELDSFVPGTQLTLRVPFEGTPARGKYRLRGTLRPVGGRPVRVDEEFSFGDESAKELERETGREAKGGGVSTLILLLAGAALALAGATVVALLRRQRRLSAELEEARRRP